MSLSDLCGEKAILHEGLASSLIHKLKLRTMHPEKGSYCLKERASQLAIRAPE